MLDPDGPGAAEPEAVAEGIEDLQIALGIDNNPNDGDLHEDTSAGDIDEWVYNHPSDSAAAAVTAAPYRAIRITVTARSIDETSNVPISVRPPAEDRDAASQADVYRRRSLSTTVELRNLAGSPE